MKKNKSIMIAGSIILGLISIMFTYVILISTGVIVGREYTLKFEAISREKEYDGTALVLDEYRLIEGEEFLVQNNHHAVVSFSGNQTDVGTSIGELEILILDEKNADVTSKYNINKTSGTLTVTPRTIIIQTFGIVTAYTGNEVNVDAIEEPYKIISGSAVPGQKLKFHVSGKQTEIGAANIEVDIEVTDRDGNAINPDNYQVKYVENEEKGQIVVRPRYIYITTYDITTYYDGNYHSASGANYNLARSELMNGHTIVSVLPNVSEVNAGEYLINKFNIKVTDASGKDVSNLYTANPNSNFGTLKILPIRITLDTISFPQAKYYDGLSLDPNQNSINSYAVRNWVQSAAGDTYKVEFVNQITNVGEIENKAIMTISNINGQDVTNNYEIVEDFGKLIVRPREIVIKTFSTSHIYDGTVIVGSEVLNNNNENYEIISGSVASGHQLFIEMNSKISNVGVVKNEISNCYILDENRNDVTDNYLITKEEGNLEVIAVAISFITEGKTWDYDGLEHSLESIDYQGLPTNCRIVFSNYPKLTDATYDLDTGEIYTVENKPDFKIYDVNNILIYDSTNINLQSNFTIIGEDWGALCVKPLELTLTTNSSSKTYDGNPCMDHQVTIEGKRNTDRITYTWPNDISTVQRDENNIVIGIDNKPNVIIYDSKNKVITQNYQIRYNCGELKINPVYLYIETINKTKVYDGFPLTVSSNDYTIDCEFINGDHITHLSTISDYIDVIVENGEIKSRANEIMFDVVDINNQSVIDNYEIRYIAKGMLTITPIELVLTTASADITYDGTEHIFDDEYTILTNTGQRIPSYISYTVSGFKGFTDALKNSYYTNDCDVLFTNANDHNATLTNNIHLVKEYGKIYIHPLVVYLSTISLEKEYDGNPFPENEDDYWYSITRVTDKDGLRVNLSSSYHFNLQNAIATTYYKAGTYSNRVDLTVYNGGINVTNNFNFEYDSVGTLEIKPIDITVYTTKFINDYDGIISKEYDGTPLDDKEIYITDDDQTKLNDIFATLHRISFTSITDVKRNSRNEVITVKNNIKVNITKNNVDITENFNITYQTGELRIDPITINLYTTKTKTSEGNILSKVYDGTPLVDNELDLSASDIEKLNALECIINVKEFQNITNVQRDNQGRAIAVDNKIVIEILKDNTDIINNFNVINNTGKLYIAPITISVNTELNKNNNGRIVSKVYDGTPLIDNTLVISNTDKQAIANIGAQYTLTDYTSITDVIWKNNRVDTVENKYKIVITKDLIDITANFDIYYTYGTLQILPLNVSIQSGSLTTYYDGQNHYNNELTKVSGFDELETLGYEYIFQALTYNQYVNAGNYTNEIEYRFVVTKDGIDVTNNVLIDYEKGKIIINKANILIRLDGASKVFDGTPLIQDQWQYANENSDDLLVELGHTLTIYETPNITKVGNVSNSFIYTITDENNASVKDNYTIQNIISSPKLIIEKLELEAISDSKSMIYDGTTLKCEQLLNVAQFEEGLPEGFTYEATYMGEQTEIGYSDNTFVIRIKDSSGKYLDINSDYRGCISVKYTYGKLEVLPYVTGTGNLATQAVTPNSEKIVFKIKANNSGIVYLRDRSYGDYNGVGWNYISTYKSYTSNLNPNAILSKVLLDNGFTDTRSIEISISDKLPYLVPYYTTELFSSSNEDVHMAIPHNNTPYTYEYINYNYNLRDLNLVDSDYISFEEEYRNYVYLNYLTVDTAMKSKLINIASRYDVTSADSNLIYKIEEMIRNNYHYGYNEGRASTSDIVSYFLNNSYTGTCQDFASAATLMYRAFGIPARYVTGFVYNVQESEINSNINVTENYAHAWTEIYIDGMGWIAIEVTNGNPANITDESSADTPITGSNASGELSKNGEEPDNNEIFKIKANSAGTYYLRNKSYGNYNGNGFSEVETPYMNGDYNPINYPSYLLNNYPTTEIYIDMRNASYQSYLVPYFPIENYASFNDIYIDKNYGSIYEIECYKYINDMFDYNDYPRLSGALALYELQYYLEVRNTYLDLDISSSLENLLRNIVATQNLNSNDPQIITKVQTYIKNCATYNYEYTIPNDCDDIVYYFLNTGKEGVCQHYAAAATLLYRYLGIPARYTTGVKKAIDQDEINSFVGVRDSSCHAWVEVYLQGFGWCPIEVTGFSNVISDSNNESDAINLTLSPKDKWIKYSDSMEIPVLNEVTGFDTFLQQGYTIECNIIGESRALGVHTTTITSCNIKDRNGNDANGLFNIHYNTGKLQIYLEVVTITTKSSSKEYDGETLICNEFDNLDYSLLHAGHNFNVNNIVFTSTGITNVGSVANRISYTNLITDNEGNDITDSYRILVNVGNLQVTRRDITLTAGSIEMNYDDFIESGLDKVTSNTLTDDGNLLRGHEISTYNMTDDSYIDENTFFNYNVIDSSSVRIIDQDGTDVTNYYNIICEDGELWMY